MVTKILSLALLGIFLCNCAVQTPQTRIERNPALYQALSSKQKELVQQGQIGENMPSGGVYLAWGNPARKSQGHRDGKSFQRWDYMALEPVLTNRFSYGYGSGYRHGRYGRHGYHGYGVGQSIDYIPYRSRTVLFHQDLVDSWEQADFR